MKKLIPFIMLAFISILLSSCVWLSANVSFPDYKKFLEMKSNWNEPNAYSFTYERIVSNSGHYEVSDKGFLRLKVIKYGTETEYEIQNSDKILDEDEAVFVPISKNDFLKRFEEKDLFSSITDVYDFFDAYYETLKKENKNKDVNVYAEFGQTSDGLDYPKSLYTESYSTSTFLIAGNHPYSGWGIFITDLTILE